MRGLLAVGLVLVIAGQAHGATLRVPSEFAWIRLAMDAAAVGDTVLVAPGTYTDCDGPCTAGVVTLKSGVALVSEGGPDVTVLDAVGPFSSGVVEARGLNGLGAVLDGFTVTSNLRPLIGLIGLNSLRLEVRNCVFTNGGPALGMNTTLDSTELVVTDCVFEGNVGVPSAIQSSGVDVLIERCVFRGCEGGVVDGVGRLGRDLTP
ncbi:MAG: hypothetical protein DHS20C21_09280 [Gemmatimonadota bacterium]|nr:MAG: hypothetical protein DHS20C21_09280 [Gemmatimonadota bacterium]